MKKWTYLVAILAMVFATPVFTGCIDNEEPAGIEELRTAKAELLRAKAAVLNAQVDALKLKAEAEAAVEAAKAAYEQALADYAAAKADSMSAAAQIAQIEAQKAAAKLEVFLMNQKAKLAEAEALYEAAMKDLALAKVQLTTKQLAYLAGWIQAAETAWSEWQTAIEAVETETQDLANLMKLMGKEEESGLLFRAEERALAKTKAAWEAAVVAAEKAAELAADTLDVDKFAETLAEMEAELEAADKAVADLEVEREQLKIDTKEEYETVVDSINYYAALTGYKWVENKQSITRVEAEYDDYGFELDAEGNRVITDAGSTEPMPMAPFAIEATGLPNGLSLSIPEEMTQFTFNYSDYLKAQAADMAFATDKGQLLAFLKQIAEELVRDENDNAWTTEYIAFAEAKLAEFADKLADTKEKWQKAVDMYKSGAPWGDPSSLDEEAFAAIEEALAAYNEAVPVFNAAAAALKEADDKSSAKNDAYQEGLDSLKAERAAAFADAEAKYNAVQPELADMISEWRLSIQTQTATINRMIAEKLLLTDSAALAAKDKEIEAATKAKAEIDSLLNDFINVETKCEADETITHTSKVDSILCAANALLENTTELAEKKYQEGHAKLVEEWLKGDDGATAELQNLKAEKVAARKALTAATKALRTARNNFFTATGLNRGDLFEKGLINKARWNENEEGEVEPLTIEDAKSLVALDKAEVQEWVFTMSVLLYGDLYGEEQNAYGDFDARLVELTEEELVEALYKELVNDLKENPSWSDMTLTMQNWILETVEANKAAILYFQLANQGDFGKYLAAENQIEVMKGYLENGEAIEALIADIDEAIASIDDDIAAATAMVEAAEASFTKLYDALAAKFEDIDAEIEVAETAKFAIQPVYNKVMAAIKTYMKYIDVLDEDNGSFTAAVDSAELAKSFGLTVTNNVATIKDLEDLHNLLDYYAAQAEEDAFAAETEYLEDAKTLDMMKDRRLSRQENAEKELEEAIAAEAEAAEAYNEAMEALAAQLEAIGESTSAEDAIMQGGNAAPQP